MDYFCYRAKSRWRGKKIQSPMDGHRGFMHNIKLVNRPTWRNYVDGYYFTYNIRCQSLYESVCAKWWHFWWIQVQTERSEGRGIKLHWFYLVKRVYITAKAAWRFFQVALPVKLAYPIQVYCLTYMTIFSAWLTIIESPFAS